MDDRDSTVTSNSDDGGKNDGKQMTPLAEDFFPGPDDVICGRGKKYVASIAENIDSQQDRK